MTDSKKRIYGILLTVILTVAAALLLCLPLLPSVLTVRDSEGRLLWTEARAGDGFAVTFTHSANKGQITENYNFLSDGAFALKTGTFESYGAGMLDQLPKGVTMQDEGDRLRLYFPPSPMSELPMIPGEIANHILSGDGYEVNLAKLSAYHRIIIRHETVSIKDVLMYS